MRTSSLHPDLTRVARLSWMAVGDGELRDLFAIYVADAVAATGATRGFVALAEAESGGLVLRATAGQGWNEQARRELSLEERIGLPRQRVRVLLLERLEFNSIDARAARVIKLTE